MAHAIERHWYRLTPISLLLWPLSVFFCTLVTLRRFLYRIGLLRSQKMSVPVIVVGNITVGGTGKTPLVIWLVRFLRERGFIPGVITRGYHGKNRHWPLLVTIDTPAAQAGDEAVLLARRAGCPVVAGPDRVAAARLLLKQGCNLIVSDDGLQHYRLARDIEICVIDGERRLGNGLCLPAGPLREPPSRLRRVSLCVSHGEPWPGEWGMYLEAGDFQNLADPAQRQPASFFTGAVHAVAGIGNPERFFSSLRRLGLSPMTHAFPDHHDFVPADLDFADGWPVLMTEKDAVKCETFAPVNYWMLSVEARPDPRLGDAVVNLLNEKRHGQKTA